MPIHGYPGNVITANPTAPTSSVATGVWTTEQQLLAVSQGNWPGYEYPISNSLRFNSADSAYLNRTPASAGNRKTWTWSAWIKRSAISDQVLFSVGTSSSSYFNLRLQDNGGVQEFSAVSEDPSIVINLRTSQQFRDPSAWYHIVFALDTSQATSSNRAKLYVNGSQVTAFSTATYPSQNADLLINNNQAHNIGRRASASDVYYSGYLAEVNFIDGQALTPSSFGLNDPETGVWSPKRYTGTYGTNGFYLPMNAGSTWSGFFDGSNDYLSVPSNAAWQYGTGDFTLECWLFGTTSGSFSNQYIFGRYNTGASAYGALQIGNSTNIYWYYGSGAVYTFTLGTALTTNQWYHFAVSRSGTSLRFFLNGTQVGSTQTDSTNYSGTAEFRIINAHQSSATYFPGYISNVRVVKGSAVYTANFTPSTTPLTAITNTVLLTCQSSTFIDNSTNNFTITNNGGALNQLISPFTPDVVDDASGNGNNWQPNNLDLRTTGVGADILVDVPTSFGTDTGVGGEVRGNYCTMNPLEYSSTYVTLNNGNLNVTGSSGVDAGGAFGTAKVNSGKWYWEATIVAVSGTYPFIGFAVNTSGTQYQGGARIGTAGTPAIVSPESFIALNGSPSGTSFTTNDILQFALDMDNGKMWIGKNGTWMNSGVPASGTGNMFSISDKTQFVSPYIFSYNSSQVAYNFGQRAFSYTAPSGFKALCTQNLPPVTIGATSTTRANNYFNAVTYTGNGLNQASGGQAISGVGFQPDWLWLKSRGTANNHILTDAVRGIGVSLSTDATVAEYSTSDDVLSFNANGFTVASDGTNIVNGLSVNYVAWNWNAGGSNQTISVGQYATSPANVPSIASTVRANTTAGFSIVTWTGTGANATVGHGLGAVPGMIIAKRRSAIQNWGVAHSSLSGTQTLYLDLTQAAATGVWNGTPTSTVFNITTDGVVNTSGSTYVAYCFAPVASYSAFGSYTGNGSTDGPFVYTGFKPAFVLLKRSVGAAADWVIHDDMRSPYNVASNRLYTNTAAVEANDSTMQIDILSNGFKLRGSGGNVNQSTNTYIYAAFAENPFKYSLAR